jgi:hypothetical protein
MTAHREAVIYHSVGNLLAGATCQQATQTPSRILGVYCAPLRRSVYMAAAALGIRYPVSKYFVAAGSVRLRAARIAYLVRGTQINLGL